MKTSLTYNLFYNSKMETMWRHNIASTSADGPNEMFILKVMRRRPPQDLSFLMKHRRLLAYAMTSSSFPSSNGPQQQQQQGDNNSVMREEDLLPLASTSVKVDDNQQQKLVVGPLLNEPKVDDIGQQSPQATASRDDMNAIEIDPNLSPATSNNGT